jgi:hypothetical protein
MVSARWMDRSQAAAICAVWPGGSGWGLASASVPLRPASSSVSLIAIRPILPPGRRQQTAHDHYPVRQQVSTFIST